MRFLPLLSLAVYATAQSNTTLLPQKLTRFPVGAVTPSGWALDQAEVQAAGLAGHLREWYSYVANSIWTPTGTEEYSDMHEAAPYWFNAMVSLPFLLPSSSPNRARLMQESTDFVQHLLDTQQDDGWLGPEAPVPANASVPRLLWPRYLVLLGLIQYAEAQNFTASPGPSSTEVISAMHTFLSLTHSIFANNSEGNPSMGFQFGYQAVRWEELVYSLQWLVDNDPQGKEAELISTMHLAQSSGFDWANDWFTDADFPKDAVPGPDTNMMTHGVNIAEALKSEALTYRYTGDEAAWQSTLDRIRLVYTYHGRPSGTYAADEHLAGLDPSRGTETCDVVEQMFSLSTIYAQFMNSTHMDMVERLAYNAFPAASLADMWSHQYDQQTNQIWAKNITDGAVPWGVNGPYSGVFGMESNYPCCTTNHGQGLPKLWQHTFLQDARADPPTVVHAILGPAQLNMGDLSIDVDTIYPFGNTLKYTISSPSAMTFQIRIPGYALGSNESTIAIDGGDAKAISPDESTSLQDVDIKAGQKTTVELTLAMPITLENRPNGAVSVHRGPLTYAVKVDFNTTQTAGYRNPQALADAERLFPDTDPIWFQEFDNHTQDNTLLPTTPWNIAIDPSTLALSPSIPSPLPSSLPHEAWSPGNAPISLTASACEIEWGVVNNAAAAPPTSPVACLEGEGKEKMNVTLTPYGATPLRIGEIPVMQV